MKNRIWELDVFRGICIIGVVLVHLVYDLTTLYDIIEWQYPAWFAFIKQWGGILFILLSGTCATLGRRSVRRGLVVFGCGLVISAVTYGMYRYGFHKSIIIYFGVLHCLGICMILWWIFKRFPTWLLAVLGIAMAAAGLYLDTVYPVDHLWLMPLGILPPTFSTSDYFPLLPNLGWFLLGAALGRKLYAQKRSRFPLRGTAPVTRLLQACGRYSLPIYMLHQPVLLAVLACF